MLFIYFLTSNIMHQNEYSIVVHKNYFGLDQLFSAYPLNKVH